MVVIWLFMSFLVTQDFHPPSYTEHPTSPAYRYDCHSCLYKVIVQLWSFQLYIKYRVLNHPF